MLPAILMTCLVAILLGGCQRAGPQSDASVAEHVARYAELPLLRKSHNPKLREELARLISERATPTLLVREPDYGWNRADSEVREALPNSAEQLETIFPKSKRWSLENRLARIYPVGRFEFRLQQLRAARSLTDEYAEQRESFRQFVAQSDHNFRLDHTQGLGADTAFVEAAAIGCRLEALSAALLLDEGQPQLAINSLEVLLRMAQLLANEPHLVPRVTAVHLRGEALQVLEAIASHPYSTIATHRLLHEQVLGQLSHWPPDSQAWIGERAQGLHTYELVRDGYLLSLLEYEEIRKYRDEIGIEQLGKQVMENVDQDEVFYLTSMRQVVESCERPYYRRLDVIANIRKQLTASRDTSLYPLVADQLLLNELEAGQRWQALDWARCRAWRLALAAALGSVPKEVPVNPLTGIPFILELRPDRVLVDAVDPEKHERPIIVTRMPPAARLE